MPKIKYDLPPQGGEKWLCRSIQLSNMFCVVMTVTIIYCIVIIYWPSIKEGNTKFKGPLRCTTTQILRNLTGTPGDDDYPCDWSSCMEWCLSKGSSPCSQMHGKIRDIGASITFSKCSLSDDHFVDHTCSTLENLTAINCKRSKWEPKKIDGKEISEGDSWKCPGQREKCTRFNDLISCEAGYCKNVSMVYDCTFTDSLASLQEKYGTKGQIDGWCNCNRCTESNGSANFFVYGQLTCPKATEYCFLPPKQFEEMRMLGRIKQEKLDELCKGPVYCQTCLDICIGQNDCLNIKSRRDVIKFGVDDKIEPEPLLTYYDCKEGNCTKVTNLVCNRTCDDKRFDMKNSKIILLQGERVVMADCENAAINDTEELPAAARVNPKLWNKMMMSCSSVTIYPDEGTRSFIKAEDCINGTWMEDLNPEVNGTVDYNTLTRKYFQVRSDPDRWIKRRQDDRYNLVPWEEDITIYNYTRLLKNQDMCVNTLAMECMDFYHRQTGSYKVLGITTCQ